MNMEAEFSPETLVSTYKSPQRHSPEDQHRNLCRQYKDPMYELEIKLSGDFLNAAQTAVQL
jgi:hypothetical protein